MDKMGPDFKALAEPHRRHLPDRLYERDGQTLTEMQGSLPLSRFGCMKHLRILEDAGLVPSLKVGREKFHYLNPVPIQRAYDRWVEKFARPWTRMLTGLKHRVEDPTESARPEHVYQIYIRATPEEVWRAITDPDLTQQYYFGTRVESEFTPGAPYVYRCADGGSVLVGEILQSEPPHRLVMTFRPGWTGEGDAAPVSQVTWEIAPHEAQSKLTLIHEGLGTESELRIGVRDGWTQIISAMKTLLETQTSPVLSMR
jgi:uncharacterized protein YndB with AHSA1/START domain/DNA-binding transcriptional ArsR family regulator